MPCPALCPPVAQAHPIFSAGDAKTAAKSESPVSLLISHEAMQRGGTVTDSALATTNHHAKPPQSPHESAASSALTFSNDLYALITAFSPTSFKIENFILLLTPFMAQILVALVLAILACVGCICWSTGTLHAARPSQTFRMTFPARRCSCVLVLLLVMMCFPVTTAEGANVVEVSTSSSQDAPRRLAEPSKGARAASGQSAASTIDSNVDSSDSEVESGRHVHKPHSDDPHDRLVPQGEQHDSPPRPDADSNDDYAQRRRRGLHFKGCEKVSS